MSADNWDTCPRCFDDARREADEAKLAVMDLYGMVPIEEFDAKRDALTDPVEADFRTFREDYEFFGAASGEVVASYSGHCSKCNLGLDFIERRKFWPEP